MDDLSESSRSTYRIEEVDVEEDESKELETDGTVQNSSARAEWMNENVTSSVGEEDPNSDRPSISDNGRKIRNPQQGDTSSTRVPSIDAGNPLTAPTSHVSGRGQGVVQSDSNNGKGATTHKRSFDHGVSDAFSDDGASTDGAMRSVPSSPSLSTPRSPGSVDRPKTSVTVSSLRRSSASASRASGNRRSSLQTIHSEHSLKSEASSTGGNKSAPSASHSGPYALPKMSFKGTEAFDMKNRNSNNNGNRNLGGSRSTSPNLRSLMRRAPTPVSPGMSMYNTNNKSLSTRRANLLASRLADRTTAVKTRLNTEARKAGGGALIVIGGLGSSIAGHGGDNMAGGDRDVLAGPGALEKTVLTRRYRPGDLVLVGSQQSRWSTLVNRHGFPPGEGSSPEEQRGPYKYVMATVKQVHFEEFAAYYTVIRTDTGAQQRADGENMEPLETTWGQQAAYRAALQSSLDGVGGSDVGLGTSGEHILSIRAGDSREIGNNNNVTRRDKVMRCLENICVGFLLPFMCIYDYLFFCLGTTCAPVWKFLLRHAKLILNGLEPYAIQVRLTLVNFIVLCSIWYMFIDQARLAVFPPRADHIVAVFNLIVFLVLFCELLFEVFIRPDGYRRLIVAEKAFSPQTVRYISGFHFMVELFSLLLFISEFHCLFTRDSCSLRSPFSFYNAALKAVTGPTRLDSALGRFYFALIRLRIFGVVRHWKNMWITNTFLMGRKRDAGWLSSIFPQRARIKGQTVADNELKRQDSNLTDNGVEYTKEGGGGGEPRKGGDDERDYAPNHRDKDLTLTNASNIGTALMVTNSYRAISLLWVITGILPIFIFSMDNGRVNDVATKMTNQLQATNLIADDTSFETCEFLVGSVIAWIMAVVAPDAPDSPDDLHLISLVIAPDRCKTSEDYCQYIAQKTDNSDRLCEQREALQGKSVQEIADILGVRVGSIVVYESISAPNTFLNGSTPVNATFSVTSSFDQSYTISTVALSSLLLQFILLAFVLGGLTVLRRDAEVLVLSPLRRMLKIVARYAKNPLVPPKLNRLRSSRRKLTQRVITREDDSTIDSSSDDSDSHDDGETGGAWRNEEFALGSYETEQLIAAVTKITDLLRKCWGVAGADIISTNLATREGALTEVFNPTVPGKSVYALFAFAAINEFDHALRNLGGDVMILINDVASVLHGEVYRWGFGDSGQCNKNLGGAFLMVFRIGLVKEVIQKLEQATSVIFSGSKASQTKAMLTRRRANKIQQQQQSMLTAGQTRRNSSNSLHSSGNSLSPRTGSSGSSESFAGGAATKATFRGEGAAAAKAVAHAYRRLLKVRSSSVKAMSLSLASLPGISTFTDRAVIGMLKSFASIHRDKKLRSWNHDFRLGAGVGAFTVSMIYGMDAGWAVEGAVGSNYKIDATYLSPHVNMASRMMSACKQYGVSIMLSQAVQELMSDVARSKLRHLDTVTVKGSSIQQKIYTYDARYQGADFFLHYRTDEQADDEAEHYTPKIWNEDPDVNVMRQHITEEFLAEFAEGRKMFLLGEWTVAKRRLEKANELMVENAIESGFLEAELEEIMNQAANPTEAAEELKKQNGDGPSQYLLNFMQSYGNVAPPTWEGWHPLTRK